MTELERVNYIIATTKSWKCKRDYLKYREKLLKKAKKQNIIDDYKKWFE